MGKLSVLILSLQERESSLLLKSLHAQAQGKGVQVLWLGDNFSIIQQGWINTSSSDARLDNLVEKVDASIIPGDGIEEAQSPKQDTSKE